jgi:hypothetical protein
MVATALAKYVRAAWTAITANVITVTIFGGILTSVNGLGMKPAQAVMITQPVHAMTVVLNTGMETTITNTVKARPMTTVTAQQSTRGITKY